MHAVTVARKAPEMARRLAIFHCISDENGSMISTSSMTSH